MFAFVDAYGDDVSQLLVLVSLISLQYYNQLIQYHHQYYLILNNDLGGNGGDASDVYHSISMVLAMNLVRTNPDILRMK